MESEHWRRKAQTKKLQERSCERETWDLPTKWLSPSTATGVECCSLRGRKEQKEGGGGEEGRRGGGRRMRGPGREVRRGNEQKMRVSWEQSDHQRMTEAKLTVDVSTVPAQREGDQMVGACTLHAPLAHQCTGRRAGLFSCHSGWGLCAKYEPRLHSKILHSESELERI